MAASLELLILNWSLDNLSIIENNVSKPRGEKAVLYKKDPAAFDQETETLSSMGMSMWESVPHKSSRSNANRVGIFSCSFGLSCYPG